MEKNVDACVVFCTTQSGALKTIFETVKELVTAVTIIFEPTGITITAMDSSKVALTHVSMPEVDIKQSGHYRCNETLSVGVNATAMFKLLKPMSHDDLFAITMGRPDSPYMDVAYRGANSSRMAAFQVKTLDVDEVKPVWPMNSVYQDPITIKASTFHAMVRDIMCVESEHVIIETRKGSFTVRGEGDHASGGFTMPRHSVEDKPDDNPLVAKNKYSLKYLTYFVKATSLCEEMIIYIIHDSPLMLDYPVTSLGTLRFVLSHMTEEAEEPTNDDYSMCDIDLASVIDMFKEPQPKRPRKK
jgi:proliferating cell nuclear antigen